MVIGPYDEEGRNLAREVIRSCSFHWASYQATTNNAWHKIKIAAAQPNSVVIIISCNPTQNDTFGVREVGSTLDSKCPTLSKVGLTQFVRVDANRDIEVYTSDKTNTLFVLHVQL